MESAQRHWVQQQRNGDGVRLSHRDFSVNKEEVHPERPSPVSHESFLAKMRICPVVNPL